MNPAHSLLLVFTNLWAMLHTAGCTPHPPTLQTPHAARRRAQLSAWLQRQVVPDDNGLHGMTGPTQATELLGLRQNAAGVVVAGQTDVRCAAMAAAAMAAGTGPASDLERQLRASQSRGCCGLPGALHLAAGRAAAGTGQSWQAKLANKLWCVWGWGGSKLQSLLRLLYVVASCSHTMA